MGQPFDLAKVTAALARAAIEPSYWPQALRIVEVCTNSAGALLLPVVGNVPLISCTPSMEASFDTYVRGGWHERDERYRGAHALLNRGVMTDDDCMPLLERKRSEFYQDFLAANGFRDWAGVRVGRDNFIWTLSLQRTAKESLYSKEELACLAELSSKLDVVAETSAVFAATRGQAALDAFQFSGRAAFLLDRAGNVVRLNQAASELLGKDIQVTSGRISASDKSGHRELLLALRQLLWTQELSIAPPIVLKKRQGGKYIIHLMRLSYQTQSPFSAWHAMMMVADTDSKISLKVDLLQRAFDLTPAEARVAASIGIGEDIGHYAIRADVSKETVRRQVKSIFSKTGTRRQAELVALLTKVIDTTPK